MQSVSEFGMQARISTSLSEHWVQFWHGLVLIRSSENVPGAQVWHCVFPCGPHSRTTPSPRLHLEQGAHRPWLLKKKKPLSHSHCVSSVAEQEATTGTLGGHLAQARQGPRPSDEENVPGRQITESVLVWIICVSLTNIRGNDETLEQTIEIMMRRAGNVFYIGAVTLDHNCLPCGHGAQLVSSFPHFPSTPKPAGHRLQHCPDSVNWPLAQASPRVTYSKQMTLLEKNVATADNRHISFGISFPFLKQPSPHLSGLGKGTKSALACATPSG